MKSMKGFWLLAVLAFLFVLGACSNDTEVSEANEGKEQESNETEEQVELQIAIEATGDIPGEFQSQIDRFDEQEENISVEIRTFSGGDSYNQALMGQVAGGVAPDIFLLDGGHRTQTFAEADAILPLEELVNSTDLDLNNFEQSLLEAFKIDGELYAIPKDYNTSALFYHKDLLEEAGVEPPTNWDELKVAAKQLTNDGQYGFGIVPQINYFLPFIETTGAELVTDAGVQSDVLESDGHIEALTLIEDLFVNDESAASPQMLGAGWDGEMFGNKDVAMLYAGSWVTGVLDENSNVGAVPLPVKDEEASMLFTAGWVVSSKSDNPEQAMKLMEFLSTDEELVEGNKAGLIGLPPTKSAMAQLITEKEEDPFLQVYAEIVEYGTPFGWMSPEFVDKYNKEMEILLYKSGEITPEEMATNLANITQ